MIPLSILLVDGQQCFLEAFALFVKHQLYPEAKVHTASDGSHAIELLKTQRVCVALVDVHVKEANGIEIARAIKERSPHTKVIIFTDYDGDAIKVNALRAGVSGYILKTASSERIKHVIEEVLSKDLFYDENFHGRFLRWNFKESLPPISFTKREEQILIKLKTGKSSKEIAADLNISESTIKSYREMMMLKTNTHNVAHLIAYAFENGILGRS